MGGGTLVRQGAEKERNDDIVQKNIMRRQVVQHTALVTGQLLVRERVVVHNV